MGGEFGPYVQSQRKDLYKPYAQQLVEEGKAYYCFCTKERLESLHDEQGLGGYDRHCRDLSAEEVQRLLDAGTPYVIRQKVPLTGSTTFEDAVFGSITIENKEIEDQVLLKADGYPTYNFANVIDDHLMHITHVVRGSEYLTSTPKYNLLYEAFGWEIPTYVHLPLIMGKNEDGSVSKLSKRHGSTSFEGLVQEGYLPEVIVNYIALLGWAPKDNQEIFSLEELVKAFSIDGISSLPPCLTTTSSTGQRRVHQGHGGARLYRPRHALLQRGVRGAGKALEVLYSILPARITKFNEIPGLLHFLKELPDYPADFFVNKKSKTNLENSPQMLQAAIPVLEALPQWNVTAIHDAMIAWRESWA